MRWHTLLLVCVIHAYQAGCLELPGPIQLLSLQEAVADYALDATGRSLLAARQIAASDLSSSACVDKTTLCSEIENLAYSVCHAYTSWARLYCARHCSFCQDPSDVGGNVNTAPAKSTSPTEDLTEEMVASRNVVSASLTEDVVSDTTTDITSAAPTEGLTEEIIDRATDVMSTIATDGVTDEISEVKSAEMSAVLIQRVTEEMSGTAGDMTSAVPSEEVNGEVSEALNEVKSLNSSSTDGVAQEISETAVEATSAVSTEGITKKTSDGYSDVTLPAAVFTDSMTDQTSAVAPVGLTKETSGAAPDVTSAVATDATTQEIPGTSSKFLSGVPTGGVRQAVSEVPSGKTSEVHTDGETQLNSEAVSEVTSELQSDGVTQGISQGTIGLTSAVLTDGVTEETLEGASEVSSAATTETGTEGTSVITSEVTSAVSTASVTEATSAHCCVDQAGWRTCIAHKRDSCETIYIPWAKANCQASCGFCQPCPLEPCEDEIPYCEQYGEEACTSEDYRIWAYNNCRQTCKLCYNYGFYYQLNINATVPQPVTSSQSRISSVSSTPSAPGACADKLDNCQEFGLGDCIKFRDFMHGYCSRFCGFCSDTEATVQTTAAGDCGDTFSNCTHYPPESCCGIYEPWARAHCASNCGFCGVPPKRECEDKISYCDLLSEDLCTNAAFYLYRIENCAGFCGVCKEPWQPPPCSAHLFEEKSSLNSTERSTTSSIPTPA